MNHESLKVDDEAVEPARESGIFADLAVRQSTEQPRAEGRSIPPPPPTRSSILPVARRAEAESSLEPAESDDVEAYDASELEESDDTEDAIEQVSTSSMIRPDASASSSRTLPPPPPRVSAPSLPGMSVPVAASAAPSTSSSMRSSSIPPGVRPVSAMVAQAAQILPSATPAPRDTSGTFQKVEPARDSYASALHGPIAMPAAQAALDQLGAPYAQVAAVPPGKSQIPYAMLLMGALIAGCFAWYMLASKMVPGVVQLTTAPADASVLFDGVPVGSVSPFLKTGVAPGEKHKLEVKKAGFRTWAQEVEVQSGQTLTFTVALPPEAGEEPAPAVPVAQPAPVAAAPAAVAVPALAAPVAAAPVAAAPVAAAPVAAPTTEAAAARPVKAAASAQAGARRASPSAVASAATGTLRVSSRPWAVISIDGKPMGNTPQMNLTLSAGSHTILLSNPEFKVEKVVNVTIQAGKTETVIVNLL